jgi:hypothetical protein
MSVATANVLQSRARQHIKQSTNFVFMDIHCRTADSWRQQITEDLVLPPTPLKLYVQQYYPQQTHLGL